MVLVIDEMCYVANLGDSRAIMSLNGGKLSQQLTKDHKPGDSRENARIYEAGGKIYQSQIPLTMGTDGF